MKYFDGDVLLGVPRVPFPDIQPSLDDYLSEMKRLDIERAVVRHRACVDAHYQVGNSVLMEEIREQSNLVPAWYVSPNGFEPEFDPVIMVDRLVSQGARMAWTTVTNGRQAPNSLQPWCAGKLLGALQERRVPLMVQYQDIPADMLEAVLHHFPALPIILLDVPRLGRNPLLYALLEQHPNLWVCINALYSVHLGLEDLCCRFGSHRILFGSRYPHTEGGASVSLLMYADIPYKDKEMIAYHNLERLLAEVRL
ncbi:MAG: amidohydrolase [Gemmatales bacterium]|nr:amidohydrolase [Gemmatales bacterium]